ncbi:hypothetical protein [Microbacterium sp. YY-01]|uniref:hypothetical protein n=1 Tax=Microbacterium sp. YY-01 TaxID=3421634 RepID=UPI003D16EB9B
MAEIMPASFKNGVPKAERNGMFGNESQLIELARASKRVTAIVTYSVPSVVHDEIADERRPVLAIEHIEPLFNAERASAAEDLRDAEFKARTGADALDLDSLDDEGDE